MNQIDEDLGESLAKPLTLALLTPLVMLVLVGGLLYMQVQELSESARWVEHSSETMALANRAYRQIIDQETGIRGFLITGQHRYLQPYERAAPLPLLERLEEKTKDNPRQQERVVEATRRYELWLEGAKNSIAQTKETGLAIEAMDRRKLRMDDLRAARRCCSG
jgi:methyl-accepting chemotaxis protein